MPRFLAHPDRVGRRIRIAFALPGFSPIGLAVVTAALLSVVSPAALHPAPLARDVVVTTQAGREVEGQLLGNGGATPVFQLLSAGAGGLATLTDASTGEFSYVPAPGFTGLDQLEFQVSDGASWSAPATLFVYVVATSQLPAPVFRASLTAGGGEASAWSEAATGSISADGRYLAFSSGAANLTSVPPASGFGVYLKDLQTGDVTRIADAFVFPHEVRISDDGQHIAFRTQAQLVPSDTNGGIPDVYVFDRTTGTLDRVSVATDGSQADAENGSFSISANGRYVAFQSHARNFVPNDSKGYPDIFLRDRVAGTTRHISVSSTGVGGDRDSSLPIVSADGRFVVFTSQSNNFLLSPPANQVQRVYLHDTLTGQTTCVSQSAEGVPANGETFGGAMSPDGRYLVFHSRASNLIREESPTWTGGFQVYVRDRMTDGLSRVGRSLSGGFLNGVFGGATGVSADGRFVTFGHQASNVVAGDTNGRSDFFVVDRRTGITKRTTIASDGSEIFPPFDSDTRGGAISADGRFAVFSSGRPTVVPFDNNGVPDVFVSPVTIEPLGHVSGTVGDASSLALAGVEVVLHDASGREMASAFTDSTGSFEFLDLPAGDYYLQTRNGQGYVNEAFGGIVCMSCAPDSGSPVAVQPGLTTTGVNFTLDAGGSLEGSVTDATSTSIRYAQVDVYTASGILAGRTSTDASGHYSVANLADGSYRVQVKRALGFRPQAFSGISCAVGCATTDGTPVGVIAGAVTSGINLVLQSIDPSAYRIYSRGATEVKLSDADDGIPEEVAIQGGLGDGIGVSPDGRLVYTVDGISPHDRILVLDAATFSPVRTITLPFPVWGMALSPDGLRIFVFAPTVNDVAPIHVLDAATGVTLGTTSIVMSGGRLVFSPDGSALYVGVRRLDTATLQTSVVPLGPMAFTPDGKLAYTIAGSEGLPVVFDPNTGQVIKVLADGWPGQGPGNRFQDVAVTADGSRALFLDGHDSTGIYLRKVWVFDTATHDLVNTISMNVDVAPRIAAAPEGPKAYVAGRSGLTVVDVLAGSILTTIPVRSGAGNLRVSPVARNGVYFDPSTRTTFPEKFVVPFTAEYGRTTSLRARLYHRGYGVAGKTVTFSLDGIVVGSAVTDNVGRAELTGVSVAGLSVGLHEDVAVASFSGDGSLPASSHAVDLTIVPATPLISWTPDPVVAGTPLGAPQLNATADVSGTFSYAPTAGSVFGVGRVQVTASFTPADLINYVTTSVTRTVIVYYESGSSSPRPEQQLAVNGYGGFPVGYDASTGTIYVPRSPNTVAIVSGLTNTVIGQFVLQSSALTAFPLSVAIDAPARRAYVSSGQHLWVFDLDSLAVVEVLAMPATAVALNSATGMVYSLRPGAPWRLNIFDPLLPPGHPSRVTTLDLAGCPEMLAFNPTTQILYSAGRCTGIDVIDVNPAELTYHTVLGSIPAVAPIAVNRLTNHVYAVTNPEGSPLRQAVVVEGNRNKPQLNSVLTQIPITSQPAGNDPVVPLSFGLDAGRGLLYAFVGYWYYYDYSPAGTVTAIDLANHTISAVWPLEQREGPFQILATPSTYRIYVFGGFRPADVLLDLPSTSAQTDAGGSVTSVTVDVGTTSLTFSDVTTSGNTSIETIDPAAANLSLPGQFSLTGAAGYEITTTAEFTGPITVCFDMSSVTDADAFSALRVLHGENGIWVDRTVSSDFQTGQICGSVMSLSPFAIASLSASYQVELLFDNTKAFKSGSTIPLKIRLLADGTNASSPLVTVSAKRLTRVSSGTSASTQDAGNANPDGNFRYSAALGAYVFNLSTKGLETGTYELSFRATGETSLHSLVFQVK